MPEAGETEEEMLDMTFVAAVLEGIEGTLDELIGRVERSDLRGRLTNLQDETAAARHLFEVLDTTGAAGDRPEAYWAHGEPQPEAFVFSTSTSAHQASSAGRAQISNFERKLK